MFTLLDAPPAQNRFQRWYFAWAQPYYERMSPDVREQAEAIDRFLYSRAGLGFWIGIVCALIGSSLGLHAAGLGWGTAALTSITLLGSLTIAALGVWLKPDKFFAGNYRLRAAAVVMLAFAGGVFGFSVAWFTKPGVRTIEGWVGALRDAAGQMVPMLLALGAMLALMLWAVATARRRHLQRAFADLTLRQERDAAACAAAEAQLQLLNLQIQPHFLFNTMAALQHWVDAGDARAAGLLRELTAFLRTTTEMLGRSSVSLNEEAMMVRHYLGIMRQRLGGRLAFEVDIDRAAEVQLLPPGLLLTLVENAVEHGIEPALHGGHLRVQALCTGDAFVLSVVNSGAGLRSDWHDGIGLANCRERLRHRFGDAATLSLASGPTAGDTQACIRIDGPGCAARVGRPAQLLETPTA